MIIELLRNKKLFEVCVCHLFSCRSWLQRGYGLYNVVLEMKEEN